jgi:uncharacterized protein YmfQ (DUF2313 family)
MGREEPGDSHLLITDWEGAGAIPEPDEGGP